MPPQTDNTIKYEQVPSTPKVPLELRGLVSESQWGTLTYEQQALLKNVETLPDQIAEAIPLKVWETLSAKQKIEVLVSYQILPPLSLGVESAETVPGESSTIEPEISDRVENQQGSEELQGTVEIQDPVKAEFEEAKERFHEIESREEVEDVQDDPSGKVTEISTMPQDPNGSTFDLPSVPKFTGYQPSKDLLSEIETHVNGSPQKSKTWTANIINKIWLAISPDNE